MKFIKKVDANTMELLRETNIILTKEQVENRIVQLQKNIVRIQGLIDDFSAMLVEFDKK